MNDETALVAVETRVVASVFGTDDPTGIVQRTTGIARALGDAIKQGHMSTAIQGREYVLAEGWAYLGSMLGVFPRTVRVDAMNVSEDGDVQGYEAHVELVTRDGSVVGGAIAECSRIESSWADRPPYALKSMAQTRATGKAYRMAFGYVMKAAGYEATPAEEMSDVGTAPVRRPPARRAAPADSAPAEDMWVRGAHTFVAKAQEAFEIGEDELFSILQVEDGDALIAKAKATDGAWITLANDLKTAIEELPF